MTTTGRVAVVNKEFARKILGSASDAMGRYHNVSDGPRIQVVGFVEDGKYTANITEALQRHRGAVLGFPEGLSVSALHQLTTSKRRPRNQTAQAIRSC